MEIESLRVGIIAPLLLWGIWIVADESLFDRYLAARKVERSHGIFSRRALLLQYMIVLALFSIIAALLVGFVSWRFLGALSIVFALYPWYSRTREREREKKLRDLIDRELPSVTQIIAILISAGVTPIRALSIISENSPSLVAKEFGAIVGDVHHGSSMIASLDRFGSRTKTRLSRRFADSIASALERGSPLSQVLIDYVRDARNEERNQIQRKSGRAEIALMIPVVFLILPISVLFALWPSLTRLGGMM